MTTRILVVDDEPDRASFLKKGLEAGGFQVDAFTDANEVPSQFKADHYDLLLRLKSTGFQLSRKLLRKDDKPKVFFMTAFEMNLRSKICLPQSEG